MTSSLPIFLCVTAAYIGSFVLVILLIAPVQKAVFPQGFELGSLIFLPHGVRILSFLFFGWMGFIYLLPGSVLMWIVLVYGAGQVGYHISGTAVSLISCYVAVTLACRLFKNVWASSGRFSWQQVMIAGVFGSLMSAAGVSALNFSPPSLLIMLSHIIGDVIGLFVILFLLMIMFRQIDRFLTKTHRLN